MAGTTSKRRGGSTTLRTSKTTTTTTTTTGGGGSSSGRKSEKGLYKRGGGEKSADKTNETVSSSGNDPTTSTPLSTREKYRLQLRHSNDSQQLISSKQQQQKHQQQQQKYQRVFNPLLLIRGMSGRALGSKIPELKPLPMEEIQKDLRLMEANYNACVLYSQKYFIYRNQKLVNSGHFNSDQQQGSSKKNQQKWKGGEETALEQINENGTSVKNNENAPPTTTPVNNNSSLLIHPLPVKIDPEEEKRLAILRKKIAQSEAQREILETQYLSLRAAYVYENQRLKRIRTVTDGQSLFLQNLCKARGRVLALRRVRVAIARDSLECLESGDILKKEDVEEMISVWDEVEKELMEAERACMNVDIPVSLLSFPPPPPTNTAQQLPQQMEETSSPPMEETNNKKRRNSLETAKKDKQPKSSSNDDGSNGSGAAKKKPRYNYANTDNVMAWEAQFLPRTHPGVPLLVSCLSNAPDRVAAMGLGPLLGSSPEALQFLDTNLPLSTTPDFEIEKDDVMHLRSEVEFLTQELNNERELNAKLHSTNISRRKRMDQMCSLMSLLRSETEAVLTRHNIILDTPEARTRATLLHAKNSEEEEEKRKKQQQPVENDDGEETSTFQDEEMEERNAAVASATTNADDTNAVSDAPLEEEDHADDEEEEEEDDNLDEDEEGGQEDDNEEEEQISMSNTGDTTPAQMSAVEDSDSVEEGEIQEDDEEEDEDEDEDDDDDDDDDDDEEGEIVENKHRKKPIKEVIVMHGDNAVAPNSSTKDKDTESKDPKPLYDPNDAKQQEEEEEEEEEEEGEIHEDDDESGMYYSKMEV